jgi:predicted nucleic acid-binding protein
MKLILDADASIKLTKIGFIEILSSGFEVLLTDVVYDEHVVTGMKKNYADAKEMERLVSRKKVSIVRTREETPVLDSLNLGRGEISIIKYCLENDVDVVVSDDAAFLRALNSMNIVPSIQVAGVLIMGIDKGLTDKTEAMEFLESLKSMIKMEHYIYVKSEIKEL